MSPSFFHDYVPAIVSVTERVYVSETKIVLRYKVQALDADGEVILGAYSWNDHAEAYDRFCSFIDEELELRQRSRKEKP